MKETIYEQYECPTCKKKGCWEHCNSCGTPIKWTNELGDPYRETNKNGKSVRYPFEMDNSVHRCMKKGQKKYINSQFINVIKLDEYRTIRRWRGPEFRCDFCGRTGDLPVMRTHHKDEKLFDCSDKLMKHLFKQKPETFINTKDHRIDEYNE